MQNTPSKLKRNERVGDPPPDLRFRLNSRIASDLMRKRGVLVLRGVVVGCGVSPQNKKKSLKNEDGGRPLYFPYSTIPYPLFPFEGMIDTEMVSFSSRIVLKGQRETT